MGHEMTMAEKILARASGKSSVVPGQFVTAYIDLLMGTDSSFYKEFKLMMEIGCSKVWDPDRIVVVIDHKVPAPIIKYAIEHQKIRDFVQAQNIRHFYDAGSGICNQILPEKGHTLPGSLIVGGDSHATTFGALGAAASGIGNSDLAFVLATGKLWFQVPETIRFVLNGNLPAWASAKDIILKIAGRYTAEFAQYRSVEFAGPAAEALSVDQRMTISNMGVEIGAKFAFFEADHKTLAYLKPRAHQEIEPFGPDRNCRYSAVHEMDVSSLEPQVACPHNVDNVKPISEIGEIPVDQAFIGSCTNSRMEDLEIAAAILKGRQVHPRTRLLVIPASREIYLRIVASGVARTFLEAGAILGPTGCGPCGGGHMGVLAPGETAISSANRNFKGRMGSPESLVYLASPGTVAASAIEGKITDPRKFMV